MDTNLEDKFLSVSKDVTDWLKFAEAKNIVLITFNSAWLASNLKSLTDKGLYKPPYIIESTLCITAILICFIAFMPKLIDTKFFNKLLKLFLGKAKDTDNLLFYKDIFKYSSKEYYEKFQKIIMLHDNVELYEASTKKFEKLLALQIVTLSGIAYKKYLLFNVSIIITIIPFGIILFDLFY